MINITKKGINNFFFYLPSRENRVHYFEKIQLYSFYFIVLAVLIVDIYNAVMVYRNEEYIVTAIALGFALICVISLVVFWRTRDLKIAQRILAIILLLLMVLILFQGGGRFGLSSLYFLASFSIFYLILDYRTGFLLPLFYFIGLLIRLNWGTFGEESIFFQPELRDRVLVVIGVGCGFGMISSFFLHHIIGYLSRLAYIDRVTNLPNEEKFKEIFHSKTYDASINNKQIALLGIKLLDLSIVNANLGIEVGNRILKVLTERLEIRGFLQLFKWNGPLFMAVVPFENLLKLQKEGQTLLNILSEPFDFDGKKSSLQYLLAFSVFPDEGHTDTQIIKNVLTMFERKNLLPGEILFHDEKKLQLQEYHYRLGAALKHANLSHEFSLVYQPKVRLSDQLCIGAEVLSRWNGSPLGPVSPEDFIPIAEENGYIRTITRWVIHEAFAGISKLPRTSMAGNMNYAINLSVIDLKDPDLVPYINQELENYSLVSDLIEFEVIESIQADSNPQIQKTIRSLAEMGFTIAIDDFGTGYSSLSYLHQLRVQNLKIDKSFIDLIHSDNIQTTYPVIDAIISMGTSMELDITAEGIETEAQAAYLRKRNCHFGQGWLFSKPLTLNIFQEFLELE